MSNFLGLKTQTLSISGIAGELFVPHRIQMAVVDGKNIKKDLDKVAGRTEKIM